VVSSYDSLSHLKQFYPETKASLKVLRFASVIEKNSITAIGALNQKYGLKSPYFLVSNQFWKHKNHPVVLKALLLCKERGLDVKIVFTGNESDHRNPGYFGELKNFVTTNGLSGMTQFLGFIPRQDQLGLMLNALAVIQPSKFEGWGTVVEDAKTLNRPVIASDIPVHREQLGDYGYYFPPDDADALSRWIQDFMKQDFRPKHPDMNYEQRLRDFARDFTRIFEDER
jgi:glycosyltransferase involved in cell wall biosynthesis